MSAPRIKVEKSKLVELIEKRYNQREMAKVLSISVDTVSKLLRENNLSTKGIHEELIGKKFGKLIVVKRLENSKDRRRRYLCKCECGNTTIVKAKYLNNGDTRSCGCYKDFESYKEKNYKEALKKIGEKYGKLTIIDVVMGDKKRKYRMICRCECGTISEKIYTQIVKGEIVSCGCYSREACSIRASALAAQALNKNREKQWYFIKDGERIPCRSGYEVIYANYLILENIEFEYEPQCFKLANGKRYTPDFYIVKENKYIEIKGIPYSILDRGNQMHRVEMFRKTHNLDICYWEDIFEKCNLPYKTYGHYKVKADYIGITPEDYLGKMIYLTY